MIKIKKVGFSLSEALITLSIIGILALLVLPGLIKDTTNKSTVSLLQSTVANLNDAVQNELTSSSARRIEDTKIYTDPDKFLQKSLDVIKVCSGETPNACYAESSTYKTLSGTSTSIWKSTKAVLLRNGVVIDIMQNHISDFGNKSIPIGIDLNGAQPPNIAGIDRQIVCIAIKNDIDNGVHIGDIGGCIRDSVTARDISTLLDECKAGNTEVCYYLLEQSGFDHNYIKTLEN